MIDILELAARRLYAAKERLVCARVMQSSPEAEIEYQKAILELGLAESDMKSAHSAAIEIGVRQ